MVLEVRPLVSEGSTSWWAKPVHFMVVEEKRERRIQDPMIPFKGTPQ